LNKIGEKAVATIEFINKDVDLNLLETVNTKRSKRLKAIKKRLDTGFYVFSSIMIAITGLMVYFAYVQRDSVLAVFTGFFALLSIGLIFMTDKSRKNDPDRMATHRQLQK